MDLFSTEFDKNTNILPKDGTVLYYGKIMDYSNAAFYFNRLLETIEWKNDEAIIFGKLITTKRKVAWYGDTNFKYSYSNITKEALLWTPELEVLKRIVEEKTAETYNSCLLNLYHDGNEGMTWHSDGEKDLKKNGAIASVSFGAERKFAFKHKTTKETVSLILEHGSVLVMKDETQTHWLHRLPPTKKINKPRINLTFRTIITPLF
ncbi:alpha-ketoglutarate-dependent dioxygenase AlkB [Flavobacterium sp. FZUC8N2.13]|uniref:Alpha-ketoglutarate-dependent dioxygenase AlkB n=1 Tax=Flavobacterium zubiriense TaxID=3138075 RepID=A0ABV4TAL1_9FLAO